MKILWRFLSLLGLPLLLWQCSSTTYTADNFPAEDYLMFGQGGGYAGSLTTHYVLTNGQLFKSERIEGAKVANGKIKARKARKIMEMYQQELRGYDFLKPGNRYFFLEYVDVDTTHALQWGTAGEEPPQAVLDFYQELQSLLPQTATHPEK